MAAQDEELEDEGEEGAKKPKRKLNLSVSTLIILVNGVLILVTLAVFAYTKLMFQRPVIAEETEIQRRQEELKTPPKPAENPLISFDQMTVNIAMTSGKSHYATIAFTLEARDQEAVDMVNAKRTLILDKIIATLGKRQVTELNTIQGKLLLKSELLRQFNEMTKPGAVSDMYFSNFILQ